jgi:hypothetical protein
MSLAGYYILYLPYSTIQQQAPSRLYNTVTLLESRSKVVMIALFRRPTREVY